MTGQKLNFRVFILFDYIQGLLFRIVEFDQTSQIDASMQALQSLEPTLSMEACSMEVQPAKVDPLSSFRKNAKTACFAIAISR